MLMYAIIVDERLSVAYPSLKVSACEEPMVRSTVEGLGPAAEATWVETTAVRTVASSGIRTDTVAPDVPTCKPVVAVSRLLVVYPAVFVV